MEELEDHELVRTREEWIARAVAAGTPEATARATAEKMRSFKSSPKTRGKPNSLTRISAAPPLNPGQRPSKQETNLAQREILAIQITSEENPKVLEASQMTLPGFHDELRAIPNHLARSPLFAPIKPGRRTVRTDEILPSPEGVVVRYSGPQLDQADCDVFMQLIYEQRGKPMGLPVVVVRQAFLNSIGRSDGGKNYGWLYSVLDRLQTARVRVENNSYILSAQLLGKVIENKRAATFEITLDPDIVEMFAPSYRSLVDWQKRLRIERRVDLAKWLHNFMASHKDRLQHHSLENLRLWSGYGSPLRKFKDAVGEALEELARIEVISTPRFYERKHPETKKTEPMVQWIRL